MLADDKNPGLCDVLWDNLPIESIQGHSLIAEHMTIPHNIVRCFVEPELLEDYTDKKYWGRYRSQPGVIRFNTFATTSDAPRQRKNTTKKLAPIGFVDEEHLDRLRQVGEKTLEGMFYVPVKYYKVKIRRRD